MAALVGAFAVLTALFGWMAFGQDVRDNSLGTLMFEMFLANAVLLVLELALVAHVKWAKPAGWDVHKKQSYINVVFVLMFCTVQLHATVMFYDNFWMYFNLLVFVAFGAFVVCYACAISGMDEPLPSGPPPIEMEPCVGDEDGVTIQLIENGSQTFSSPSLGSAYQEVLVEHGDALLNVGNVEGLGGLDDKGEAEL